MPTRENNADIEGTLANRVAALSTRLEKQHMTGYASNGPYTIPADGFLEIRIDYTVPQGYTLVNFYTPHVGSHYLYMFGKYTIGTQGDIIMVGFLRNTAKFDVDIESFGFNTVLARL